MECLDAIMTRRSVRSYEKTPVAEETLIKIINAGTAAPSAVNYQPWYFVAVRSAEAMERLTAIMSTATGQMETNLSKLFPKHPEVVKETCAFMDNLGCAPVCILVFQTEDKYAKSESDIHQSIAAAIENMILEAWSEGIGSCWLTAPINYGLGPKLHDEFAPDKGKLVAAVTFGYPARVPKAPRLKEGRFVIV